MLSTEVENRLLQLNPWLVRPKDGEKLVSRFLPPVYIPRRIENIHTSPDRAVLIIGPRQAGKSTLVWHQLFQLMPDVLFINMEDPQLRYGCGNAIQLAAFIRVNLLSLKAIFIDEVQHLEEGALFIKGLVDSRLRVVCYVTGSSSFHLQSRTRESLAGRATRRVLLPFSHSELLSQKKASNPLSLKQYGQEITAHQLIFGSYPAIYLAKSDDEKKHLLSDLVEALILRDASDMYRIKRVDAFRKLLALLAGQIGQLVNISELASICNVDVGTISSYIEILDESHIIKKIIPFAAGKRREIIKNPKVYFIDNGIRNQLIQNFEKAWDVRVDKGQLFENWAFSELLKRLPIQSNLKFWRSKSGAEVDAVIEHAGKLFALEIKATIMKQPAITRSLQSFIDAYQPEQTAVLNIDLETTRDFRRRPVHFLTPESLPIWIDKVFS